MIVLNNTSAWGEGGGWNNGLFQSQFNYFVRLNDVMYNFGRHGTKLIPKIVKSSKGY